jgi:fucose 4-O-acetylase-like acetyltransferase
MRRYHDLDALRALAMLLGIAWHVSAAYLAVAPIEWFHSFSHSFRMPLFFLIAGFFAAMLVERRGEGEFVSGRLHRIGLPLLVGLVTIVPLNQALDAWAQSEPYDLIATPLHLWFLEYLLVFYALALLIRRVAPGRWSARTVTSAVLSPVWRLPIGVLGATAALVVGGGWPRESPAHLVPDPGALAYYGVFFTAGWLLWPRRDEIGALGRTGWLYGAVALGVSIPFVALENRATDEWVQGASVIDPMQIAYFLVSATLAWCMIFGLMQAARRLHTREQPVVRYLVDASYWMYLTHLPLAVVSVELLEAVPAGIAFPLATALTCAITLATYAAFVRYGRIGAVLHGPRHRPTVEPAV